MNTLYWLYLLFTSPETSEVWLVVGMPVLAVFIAIKE